MKEPLPEPICNAVKVIFAEVGKLRQSYPGKRFTPGDKLVGDIGEVLAEHFFDVVPLSTNSKSHDCKCRQSGKHVQVKATGGERVGLGLAKETFDHLLVFKLYPEGEFEIVYNGGGQRVADKICGNTSPSIQVNALRVLDQATTVSEKLSRKTPSK